MLRRGRSEGAVRGPASLQGADPAGWARKKMAAELAAITKLNTEPDIKCIKGYPSNAGYLSWLKRFKEKFDRDDLLLVVATNKEKFSVLVHAEIQREIDKYEALLVELERSPRAVEDYISALEENVRKWKNVLRTDPNIQNEHIDPFICETTETVKTYSALLKVLLASAKK